MAVYDQDRLSLSYVWKKGLFRRIIWPQNWRKSAQKSKFEALSPLYTSLARTDTL